jgi:hypothetical protein
MTNELMFSVNWLDGASNRALEERATAAELEIWLSDINATEHVSGGRRSGCVNVPAYSIAEGLALDWWRLFGSREEEVCLRKYRSGFAIPDIRMRFDGYALEVCSEQTFFRNPDVRFFSVPALVMSRGSAEKVLSEFIERTLARLSDQRVGDTTASLRWKRVCASRNDPAERTFCEAAAALGEDPYDVSDSAASIIEKAGDEFAGDALTEVLAGARETDVNVLLNWTAEVRAKPAHRSHLGELRGFAQEAALKAPVVQAEPGWARGYRRARALRTAMQLVSSDRINTYRALATKMGNTHFQPSPPVNGIRALRAHDEHHVHLHLRGTTNPHAESTLMYALARGIGDVACFPEDELFPINDLRNSFRQRCNRAFAAEFLAPINEIRSMQRDGYDVHSISSDLNVSTDVIDRQLENKDRIESACAI